MTEPEYISYRRAFRKNSNLLSRVRFPEAKNILSMVKTQLAGFGQDPTVLDMGCGSGASSMHLAYYANIKNIVGIDLDKAAIHQAQSASRFLRIQGLHFIVASADNLPVRNATLNFILCQELLEHVREPEVVLQEIKRTLESGGALLLTTPVTAFAPLSSDWLEMKLHDHLIIDEFAMHMNRFRSDEISILIHKAGLLTRQSKFTNQYVAPFTTLALTLHKRRNLRKVQNKTQDQHDCSRSFYYSLPNAILMLGQTIEYAVFKHLPFGSNIVIVARNH